MITNNYVYNHIEARLYKIICATNSAIMDKMKEEYISLNELDYQTTTAVWNFDVIGSYYNIMNNEINV